MGHRRNQALVQLVVLVITGGGHSELDLASSVARTPRLLDSQLVTLDHRQVVRGTRHLLHENVVVALADEPLNDIVVGTVQVTRVVSDDAADVFDGEEQETHMSESSGMVL